MSAGVVTVALLHQLVHQLFAQPFDIHGAAAGKMQQGLLALRRAEQPGACNA